MMHGQKNIKIQENIFHTKPNSGRSGTTHMAHRYQIVLYK